MRVPNNQRTLRTRTKLVRRQEFVSPFFVSPSVFHLVTSGGTPVGASVGQNVVFCVSHTNPIRCANIGASMGASMECQQRCNHTGANRGAIILVPTEGPTEVPTFWPTKAPTKVPTDCE